MKAQPMTTKKQSTKQPKKAPLSAKTVTESKAPEKETQQPTTTSEQQKEAPTTSAAGSAFSAADVAEINEELGIEEIAEPGTENDNPRNDICGAVSADTSGGNSGPTSDDGDNIQSNPGDEPMDTENVVSLEKEREKRAVQEQQARDIFYGGLKGGLDVANGRMTLNNPFGKYQSLNLDNYGPISRDASDQLFDRLCDVPLFKQWLLKLSNNTLMDKWGAVFVLAYTVFNGMKQEQAQRREMLKQKQADAEQEKAA